MRLVLLANGKAVQVSDEDYPLVADRPWWEHYDQTRGLSYAFTHEYLDTRYDNGRRRKRKIYMHRLITDCPPGYVVDHWDEDGLNNQRWNLRIATHSQNAANHDGKDGICGFRGVTLESRRYRARIMHQGERHSLGLFEHMEDAARAYDRAARTFYGEFAWLNFDERRDLELARQAAERILSLEEMPF